MQKQDRSGEEQGPGKWTGWVPALWSIEAIVIAGGLGLGALVLVHLAKPAFDGNQDKVGYLFIAMAALCPLFPSVAAAHIYGVHRKMRLPR